MAGITIPIATDTRQAAKEVNDLSKGFDKVADSLDDVEKAARGTDKLDDNLKDAQRETKQTTDAFEKLARAQREAASGGDDFGSKGSAGLKKVGQTSEEVGSELRQNIGETFSSFRGDVSDFGQIAQDTLGGLASGLEGIPAIAAVAAGAAGIGLIMGALTNSQEQGEAFQQKVADITQALIDAGSTGQVSLDYVVDEFKKLATTGDDAGKTLRDLKKLADGTGMSFEDLAKAYTGNGKALDAQIKSAKEVVSAYDQMVAAANGDTSQLDSNLNKRYLWAQETVKTLEQVKAANQQAAENEKLWLETGGPQLQAKSEATKAYTDSVKSALQDAGAAMEDFNNDGQTTLDEYNEHIEASIKAVQQYQQNMVIASASLSQEALNYIESLGQDAAPLLQQYVDAPLAQQQRTANNWAQLGAAASSSYTNNLKAGIPSAVDGPTVNLRVDDSALRRAINSQKGVQIPVQLVGYKDGKRVF